MPLITRDYSAWGLLRADNGTGLGEYMSPEYRQALLRGQNMTEVGAMLEIIFLPEPGVRRQYL